MVGNSFVSTKIQTSKCHSSWSTCPDYQQQIGLALGLLLSQINRNILNDGALIPFATHHFIVAYLLSVCEYMLFYMCTHAHTNFGFRAVCLPSLSFVKTNQRTTKGRDPVPFIHINSSSNFKFSMHMSSIEPTFLQMTLTGKNWIAACLNI